VVFDDDHETVVLQLLPPALMVQLEALMVAEATVHALGALLLTLDEYAELPAELFARTV
jgi:hypothetical protein